jgi:hypothetical protein
MEIGIGIAGTTVEGFAGWIWAGLRGAGAAVAVATSGFVSLTGDGGAAAGAGGGCCCCCCCCCCFACCC